MKIFSRQTLMFGIVVVALAALFATTSGQATSPPRSDVPLPADHPDWELAELSMAAAAGLESVREGGRKLPPPPKQDPCLHCHIKGEEKGLWTPLARWVVFGTAGLIFVFGVVRSASAWKTRKPWKPLTVRAREWLEERYHIAEPLSKILDKPVPEWQRRWWYCLGGLTAFFFVVQGFTGILLAFYYKPTPEAAYASIQFIENEVFFGAAIRMIHHWSANGMVILVIAHMMRVFIMGAYKKPRELNWVSGVVLFIVTLAFGFTGYLLPWDQRAYWATTVGSEIAGSIPVVGHLALIFLRVGWDITALTLSRFYGLHVLVLPLIIVSVMLLHFIMVRRQGIMKPL